MLDGPNEDKPVGRYEERGASIKQQPSRIGELPQELAQALLPQQQGEHEQHRPNHAMGHDFEGRNVPDGFEIKRGQAPEAKSAEAVKKAGQFGLWHGGGRHRQRGAGHSARL